MSTGGKVCVETASEIEKLSPPSEKRNNYTTAPGETVLATSNSDKFHSVMPSCEKWQLGAEGDALRLLRTESPGALKTVTEAARYTGPS